VIVTTLRALLRNAALLLWVALSSTWGHAQPTVIVSESFDAPTFPAGWGIGAQLGAAVSISTDRSLNYEGSAGSLRGIYPPNAKGGSYIWANYSVSALNLSDIYIEFKAKMPSNPVRGLKFVKIFGKNLNGYSNTTFAPIYDSGLFREVSFGDGIGTTNDTTRVIRFDGTNPELIGRSHGIAKVNTPQKRNFEATDWGDKWHHVRIRVKFNSGSSAETEVADGAYYLEIDGKVYLDATNIFNRHWSNGPIDKVSFFGWTQLVGEVAGFEVWYDDITISTGGFISTLPSAPELNVL
jgi:hypothetical protein